MPVVLAVLAGWVAFDLLLLALWVAAVARRRRPDRALPLGAALNSGHAEDAPIRHTL
jgi:hypothetical protein